MDPTGPVQRQLDAYNACDLDAFVAEYADGVQLFKPPAAQAILEGKQALAEHYGTTRFNQPGLHAELVARMVFGNKVIDQERITGLGPEPVDAAVVFEVQDNLIFRVWFFGAN